MKDRERIRELLAGVALGVGLDVAIGAQEAGAVSKRALSKSTAGTLIAAAPAPSRAEVARLLLLATRAMPGPGAQLASRVLVAMLGTVTAAATTILTIFVAPVWTTALDTTRLWAASQLALAGVAVVLIGPPLAGGALGWRVLASLPLFGGAIAWPLLLPLYYARRREDLGTLGPRELLLWLSASQVAGVPWATTLANLQSSLVGWRKLWVRSVRRRLRDRTDLVGAARLVAGSAATWTYGRIADETDLELVERVAAIAGAEERPARFRGVVTFGTALVGAGFCLVLFTMYSALLALAGDVR